MRTTEIESSVYQPIPWRAYALRRIASAVTTILLPKRVLDPSENGLTKAKQLAEQGYGSVFFATHPSQGEIPRLLTVFGGDPVLGHRPVIVPETAKHYEDWHNGKGKWARITVSPITGEDSIEYFAASPKEGGKKEKKKYERRKATYEQMLDEARERYMRENPAAKRLFRLKPDLAGPMALAEYYLEDQTCVLKEGGIALIFVQGGRRPYLEDITKAVSKLIERTNKEKVDKFTLTAVGVEIKGVTDYADASIRGYNVRQQYLFTIGETDISEEFQQEARNRKLTLDQLAREKLGLVIPPTYRPPKKPEPTP